MQSIILTVAQSMQSIIYGETNDDENFALKMQHDQR